MNDAYRLPNGDSPRTRALAVLDAYYASTQYDHLTAAWDQTLDARSQPIPFRSRKPSTIIPLAKVIVDAFTHGLWGVGRRPIATLAGAPGTEDNAALAAIIREAGVIRTMRESTRRALSIGSGVVAWCLREDRLHSEAWDAKWCSPTFKPGSSVLAEIDYRFPFTREVNGEARTFYARQHVDEKTWIVYQPTEVIAGREPAWSKDAALSVEHGLGFCPVVWFTVLERGASGFDGTSVYASLLSIFDDLNYTASQQGRALYQNLDPTTVISGVSEADVQALLKGGPAWTLPKDGKASLLESNGTYVTAAQTRIDALKKWALDACAIILNDPEKVSGGQSGTALELLTAPMLAAIDDLRDDIGNCGLVPLLAQMLSTRQGAGALPWHALPVVLSWGRHYSPTPQDSLTAAQAAEKAVALGIVSRASAARFLSPFFGVVDVEVDQEQVAREAKVEDAREANLERVRQRAGFDDPNASPFKFEQPLLEQPKEPAA